MKIFELTPTQQRAFNSLVKALKKCEDADLLFYNNYGTLGVCDRKKVKAYNDEPSEYMNGDINNPNEVQLPCNEWADDTHYFHVVE